MNMKLRFLWFVLVTLPPSFAFAQADDQRLNPSFAYDATNPLQTPRMYRSTVWGASGYYSTPHTYSFEIETGYNCSSTNPCTGDPVIMVELFDYTQSPYNATITRYTSDDQHDLNAPFYAQTDSDGKVSFSVTVPSGFHYSAPYRFVVHVFAYDEAYEGQTNLLIKRNGSTYSQVNGIRFSSKTIRAKWRQGDQLTYTPHYTGFDMTTACGAIGGTWDIRFTRCNLSNGSTQTPTQICQNLANQINLPRLKYQGVFPHSHKCEYTLTKDEEPSLILYDGWTKNWSTSQTCYYNWWTGGQTCYNVYSTPNPSTNQTNQNYYNRIAIQNDGQDDDHAIIAALGPWDSSLSPTVTREPIRLYKEGLNNNSDSFQDTDSDGISDRLETILGTNLSNDDTDSDGILDGLELWGTYDLPLPSLGASPFIRDIVVELDWDEISHRQTKRPVSIAQAAHVFDEAQFNLIVLTGELAKIGTSNHTVLNTVNIKNKYPGNFYHICVVRDDNDAIHEGVKDIHAIYDAGHLGDDANAGQWCRSTYPPGEKQETVARIAQCFQSEYLCDNNNNGQFEACTTDWKCIDEETQNYTDLKYKFPFIKRVVWVRNVGCGQTAGMGARSAYVSDRSGCSYRTFAHELGHTMGLGHGGMDNQGRKLGGGAKKLNYWSTMSYGFRLPFRNIGPNNQTIYLQVEGAGRKLFSNVASNFALDETNVRENLGLGGGANYILRGVNVRSDFDGDGDVEWQLPGGFNGGQDRNFNVVDWNRNGNIDQNTFQFDIDQNGCAPNNTTGNWEKTITNPDGTTRIELCQPVTNMQAPRTDLNYLTNQTYRGQAASYLVQRELLRSTLPTSLTSQWPIPANPMGYYTDPYSILNYEDGSDMSCELTDTCY